MKSGTTQAVALRAALAVFALASVSEAGQIGSVYRRSADWVPGTAGQVSGNPGPTPQQAWTYEWVSGGSMNSAAPWYRQAATPMSWDAAWYGQTNVGLWSRGDNGNPPVGQFSMLHNEAASVFNYQPLVRWTDPAPGVPVNVSGNLVVKWSGRFGIGRPTDVEVVIAKQNAGRTTTSLLFSQLVIKPNAFPSVGDQVSLPVNITNLSLLQGESMIITLRATTAQLSWVQMYDNLNISTVPAPAGVGLLAMGGLVAARRKRR
jgi:hypothetical protein